MPVKLAAASDWSLAAPRAKAGPSRGLLVASAFAAVAALQVYLVFSKSINWDEFFHFQHIHELRTGTLSRSLQVLYVRYFEWLFDLPVDPINQLLVGRLVLLLCEPLTGLAIYGIVRQFAGRATAALCVLAYVTGGYVFLHGFAFRADPQATALLMCALWLFVCRKLDAVAIGAIALMLALAAMITVKSIFYAPVFAGLFLLRLEKAEDRAGLIRRCVAMLALTVLLFVALFLLHGATLAAPPVDAGTRELASAGTTVFSAGLLPQAGYLVHQVLIAPYLMGMIAVSPFLWRRRLPLAADRIAMIGLLLPLATIVFYRNSYPYYYVFVLAPAVVAIFPAVELLVRRFGAVLCGAVLVAQAMTLALLEPRGVLDAQRSISAAVHQLFPRSVAYVDFCGVIGNFPRALPFLTSGWGLQRYRLAGRPALSEQMAREPVPLLIDNAPVLDAAVNGGTGDEAFLDADAKALRENFVHHWGPIWVAGKRIPAGTKLLSSDIAVPGTYTVEGAAMTINGKPLRTGDTVELQRGPHRILPDRARTAILRWGDHLAVPDRPAPAGPFFTNY